MIDLFLFAGQSNMAGRGVATPQWPQKAPILTDGAGFEFRAVSDPTRLYPVEEPFGRNENREGGIRDIFSDGYNPKTGSLVTAFCNAYFEKTGVPIVAVSASKGGSHIGQWQPDSPEGYLPDMMDRYKKAVQFLREKGIEIRHQYVLWCQGESDGELKVPKNIYKERYLTVWEALKNIGAEKCFIIKIGNCNVDGAYDRYCEIQEAQEELARENPDTMIASRVFEDMLQRGLMKDAFHYFQQGYNECGYDAGKCVGEYVRNNETEV